MTVTRAQYEAACELVTAAEMDEDLARGALERIMDAAFDDVPVRGQGTALAAGCESIAGVLAVMAGIANGAIGLTRSVVESHGSSELDLDPDRVARAVRTAVYLEIGRRVDEGAPSGS